MVSPIITEIEKIFSLDCKAFMESNTRSIFNNSATVMEACYVSLSYESSGNLPLAYKALSKVTDILYKMVMPESASSATLERLNQVAQVVTIINEINNKTSEYEKTLNNIFKGLDKTLFPEENLEVTLDTQLAIDSLLGDCEKCFTKYYMNYFDKEARKEFWLPLLFTFGAAAAIWFTTFALMHLIDRS